MDLSTLKAKAQAPQSTGAQAGGGSFVVDITQVNFQQVLGESVRYPVVVEFWSPRAEGTAELSRTLADLANSSGGRFLLGRVDVDTEGQIAQALGVQAVPTVVAVLGGQLAPLFQGAQPADQVRAVIDQVLQTAVANGIVGTAPSQGAEAESDEGAEPRPIHVSRPPTLPWPPVTTPPPRPSTPSCWPRPRTIPRPGQVRPRSACSPARSAPASIRRR